MEIKFVVKNPGTFVQDLPEDAVFIHDGHLFTRVRIGPDLVGEQTDSNVCFVYDFGKNCVIALDGNTFISPKDGPLKSKLEVYSL